MALFRAKVQIGTSEAASLKFWYRTGSGIHCGG